MATEARHAEIAVSGVTAFAASPAPNYRYEIACKSNKLVITLEEEMTKKKWCTSSLSEEDYMTSTNRIANATTADYISIFKDALDYLMGTAGSECSETSRESGSGANSSQERAEEARVFETQRIRRRLTPLENQTLQLELTVKFKVLRSAWGAKYLFPLKPFSRDRVDRLEAKLLNVEQRLAAAEKRLVERGKESASLLEMYSSRTSILHDEGLIRWKEIKEGDFELSSNGFAVRFLITGTYIVSLKVFLTPQKTGGHVDVYKNTKFIMWDRIPLNAKRESSVSLVGVVSFKENDEMSVYVTCSPHDVEVDVTATKVGE